MLMFGSVGNGSEYGEHIRQPDEIGVGSYDYRSEATEARRAPE